MASRIAGNDLGVEGVGNIRGNQDHNVAAPLGQGTAQAVHNVAQLVDGGLHLGNIFRRHAPGRLAAGHEGDGGGRDTGPGGNHGGRDAGWDARRAAGRWVLLPDAWIDRIAADRTLPEPQRVKRLT